MEDRRKRKKKWNDNFENQSWLWFKVLNSWKLNKIKRIKIGNESEFNVKLFKRVPIYEDKQLYELFKEVGSIKDINQNKRIVIRIQVKSNRVIDWKKGKSKLNQSKKAAQSKDSIQQ